MSRCARPGIEVDALHPWHALAFWIVDNALVVLVVTVLGICGTVVGPLLLSQLNAHQRRLEKIQDNEQRLREKEEDYARQDEVARRAREVADRLIESQRHTTEQTDTVVHLIEENAAQLASINEQTAQIHILVNSDMTAARQAELDQTRATKVVLLKVIALDRAAGRQPSKDDTEAVVALDERIAELTAILADRLAAQTKVEQHMEVDAQT